MNRDERPQNHDSAIPLLEDVVSMEEIESELIEFADDEAEIVDSGIPEYDEELLAMRDEIAKQLEDDLGALVTAAINRVVDDTATRISQILHDELDSTLAHRIIYLIEQRLEKEFGPRKQHSNEEVAQNSIEIYHDDNL
ncbi:MAG: hypothetical protein ABW098_14445 [Candidatus Thiodiazotropha sp.]